MYVMLNDFYCSIFKTTFSSEMFNNDLSFYWNVFLYLIIPALMHSSVMQ